MRFLPVLLLLAAAVSADRAITVHGTLLTGSITVVGDELVVTRNEREKRYPKIDYLLAEKDDGTLLYAQGYEGRVRAYAHLARIRRREALADLVDDAIRARDAKLAREILERAESDGYTGKDAEKAKRKLVKLEAKKSSPDGKKATRVRAGLEAALRILPDLLLARARLGDGDSLKLLREVLRATPDSAAARALLDERAPKGFPAGSARFWLDFHLDLEARSATLLGDDEFELRRARGTWRKDVYGVRAGPIQLVTPVRDTRTVGRCLAYGTIVCEALDTLFRTDKPNTRATRALLILLYENREEYIAKSGGSRRPEERAFLMTTAGHYSPMEQVSRLVWERDRDAERRVARVFAHELTHHWTMQFNPRYRDVKLRVGSKVPGYWIVEGLATFLEEGAYDIETGAWELFDGRARSLDVVQAVARMKRLLPWKAFYALPQRGLRTLQKSETKLEVFCRWKLGAVVETPGRLFYEQAGATVQFLYHGEEGRYRPQLVEYVTNYYTGQAGKLDIQTAFGLSAADLGRKVEAFAQEVADGWRPERK